MTDKLQIYCSVAHHCNVGDKENCYLYVPVENLKARLLQLWNESRCQICKLPENPNCKAHKKYVSLDKRRFDELMAEVEKK